MGEDSFETHLKLIRLVTIFLLLAFIFVGFAAVQEVDSPYIPGAVPRFTVICHADLNVDDALSASELGSTIPLWTGNFTSSSTAYPFIMVGTDPSQRVGLNDDSDSGGAPDL